MLRDEAELSNKLSTIKIEKKNKSDQSKFQPVLGEPPMKRGKTTNYIRKIMEWE